MRLDYKCTMFVNVALVLLIYLDLPSIYVNIIQNILRA